MIPLPKTFKRDGFDFELVHRTGDIGMLRKTKQGLTRLIESWEVVKIQKAVERTFQDATGPRVVPARECLPSDETWGILGWTFTTRDDAWKRFLALSK